MFLVTQVSKVHVYFLFPLFSTKAVYCIHSCVLLPQRITCPGNQSPSVQAPSRSITSTPLTPVPHPPVWCCHFCQPLFHVWLFGVSQRLQLKQGCSNLCSVFSFVGGVYLEQNPKGGLPKSKNIYFLLVPNTPPQGSTNSRSRQQHIESTFELPHNLTNGKCTHAFWLARSGICVSVMCISLIMSEVNFFVSRYYLWLIYSVLFCWIFWSDFFSIFTNSSCIRDISPNKLCWKYFLPVCQLALTLFAVSLPPPPKDFVLFIFLCGQIKLFISFGFGVIGNLARMQVRGAGPSGRTSVVSVFTFRPLICCILVCAVKYGPNLIFSKWLTSCPALFSEESIWTYFWTSCLTPQV